MFRKDLLAAKRILITGGGTGLGAVMAERFAGLGARLVLCGRRLEMLEATAERLRCNRRALYSSTPSLSP